MKEPSGPTLQVELWHISSHTEEVYFTLYKDILLKLYWKNTQYKIYEKKQWNQKTKDYYIVGETLYTLYIIFKGINL